MAEVGGLLYLGLCAFIIVPSLAVRWGWKPPEWFYRGYRRFLSYL